jgi:hypothetical protein
MALTVAVMGALGGYYLYNKHEKKSHSGGRKSRRSKKYKNRSMKSRK